jgi:hypothetical protein
VSVKTHLGRHRSERSKEEEMKILLEELDNLDDDEREAVHVMLSETLKNRPFESVKTHRLPDGTVLEDRGKPLFDLIQETEYLKQVVDVDTWIKDSYFMGQCAFKWPRWQEDLRELFGPSGYHEAILTGAIGIGKSTFVEMALLRMIYEYSCLRNPQRTYGLMPGDKIYIVVLNVNTDLAQKVVFEGLVNKLEQSPYFQKEYEFEATQKVIRFPNGLRIIPRASTDTSALGLNVIGGVLSEVNFNDGGHFDSKRQASATTASRSRHGIEMDIGKVYSELITRLKSRFGRVGKLPGLFLLDSSKKDQSDFTETHMIEVKDDPFVFVRDYAMWDVQPADRFSKKKFRVFVGDEKVSSRILGPDEDVHPIPGSAQQIIEVPDNWRLQFERNLDAAIRNVAGIATISIDRLFSTMQNIRDSMDRAKKLMPSPFAADTVVFENDVAVDWTKISHIVDGAWALKYDPRAEHAVHFDIAFRRDRFGMAFGYLAGVKMVERVIGGEIVLERAPIIVIRAVLGIEAPRDGEVKIGIGRAVLWSAMKHGLRVRWGSCDQYQSVETLQKMEAKGIDTDQISVEGEEAYLMLRDAFMEDRLLCVDNSVLYDELKHLVHDKARGKVDHPPGKSKDIADGICGVVYRLTKMFLADEARPLIGDPTIGVSELYQAEDEDEETWVLDGTARPLEHGEQKGRLVGGSAGATDVNPKRRKNFILR